MAELNKIWHTNPMPDPEGPNDEKHSSDWFVNFVLVVLIIGGPFAIAIETSYGSALGILAWLIVFGVWIYLTWFDKDKK